MNEQLLRVRPRDQGGAATGIIRSSGVGAIDSSNTGSVASSNPFRVSSAETSGQIRRGIVKLARPVLETELVNGLSSTSSMMIFFQQGVCKNTQGAGTILVKIEKIITDFDIDAITWANQGDQTFSGSQTFAGIQASGLGFNAEKPLTATTYFNRHYSLGIAANTIFGFRFKPSDEAPSSDPVASAETFDFSIAVQTANMFGLLLTIAET